jgi:mannose-6-phosphate isomerase class I
LPALIAALHPQHMRAFQEEQEAKDNGRIQESVSYLKIKASMKQGETLLDTMQRLSDEIRGTGKKKNTFPTSHILREIFSMDIEGFTKKLQELQTIDKRYDTDASLNSFMERTSHITRLEKQRDESAFAPKGTQKS